MWKKMKDLLLTLLAITVTIAIGGLIVYVLYDGYQHLTTFTIFCAGLFGVLIFFLESISKLEEYANEKGRAKLQDYWLVVLALTILDVVVFLGRYLVFKMRG